MKSNSVFQFFTRLNLIKLLAIRARNPRELLEGLKFVPPASVYYHTHRYLEQHNYLTPEPPNDFAYWLTHILNLEALGERMASVDIIQFKSLEELRAEFIRTLTAYTDKAQQSVQCQEGQEFHFMSCLTFVMPTPYRASNLVEFEATLRQISINSLYFHIFEAHRRLGRDENDFTAWFKKIGQQELAAELAHLDPYTYTLEGLREKIIKAVRKYA